MIHNRLLLSNYSIVVFVLLVSISLGNEPLRSCDLKERDVLIQKSHEGDISAVQALGQTKDASLIPMLERQLDEAKKSKKANPVYVRTLRKSLARLGDPNSRKEILQEISSKDRYAQYHAFEDAADVGGDDMVVAIAEKLFDPSPGGRPTDEAGNLIEDVSLPAPRHASAIALSRIIDDPTAPRIDLKRITYSDDNVQKWRNWWNANKVRFLDPYGK